MKLNLPKLDMKDLGKNPSKDWFLLITLFSVLCVVIVLGLSIHFYGIRAFINNDLIVGTEGQSRNNKTKEEELREVISFYVKKQALHESILKNSGKLVEKNPAPVATSTVSTSTPAGSIKPEIKSTNPDDNNSEI